MYKLNNLVGRFKNAFYFMRSLGYKAQTRKVIKNIEEVIIFMFIYFILFIISKRYF